MRGAGTESCPYGEVIYPQIAQIITRLGGGICVHLRNLRMAERGGHDLTRVGFRGMMRGQLGVNGREGVLDDADGSAWRCG